MSGFTTVDMIVLIIYLLIVLLIGIFFSKKEMKGKEYFKGDGTIPWWVTSVSIFATLLSPISFLSIVGNSFNGTWLLWFAQLGVFIAVPITIKFFLPIYSRLDIDTAYHYLELRYNDKGLRALGAFMFIIYQIGRMSIIMYLPSIVLSELIGTNVNILIIIMGIIAIIYSYKGGIKSVLWTDFIQGIVLIIGVSFTLIFLAHSIDGGIGEVFNYLINNKFLAKNETIIDLNILNSSVFIIVVGSGVNIFSSYISSQDIVQRFTTTTDLNELNKMTYGNAILSIVIATLLYLIGTLLFIFYRQNPELLQSTKQDQIFASYIVYQLPVGISGIVLAAIYAAAQSTLSTGLNSIATSWILDIQNTVAKEKTLEKQTNIAKFISLFVGIIAIIVSIVMANGEIKSAYEWFNGFMGLVLGVVAGIFVLGIFTKKATNIGAYIGFFVSAIIVINLKYNHPEITSWSYSIITIATCCFVGYFVSIIHRKLCDIVLTEEATIYYSDIIPK